MKSSVLKSHTFGIHATISKTKLYFAGLFWLFTLCGYSCFGQIYNYYPVSYNDVETNPALLASSKVNNRVMIAQSTGITKSNFSVTSGNICKYFEGKFIGLGLLASRVRISDGGYDYAGIGAAYRNVLFNKVMIKFGLTYKWIKLNAISGAYDYLNFTPSPINAKSNDNLNISASLSSGNDEYYISVSSLNLYLPWNDKSVQTLFPRYNVVNVGNLKYVLHWSRLQELSYSGIQTSSIDRNHMNWSHFMNVRFIKPITRKISSYYGVRAGIVDNRFYQISPTIVVYGKKIVFNGMINFQQKKSDFTTEYFPFAQLSITYHL